MKPIDHPKATKTLGAPPGWNEAHPEDQITPLPIRPYRVNNGPLQVQSWWKPSPDEITVLQRGGVVVHDIMCKDVHPVALYVEDHPDFFKGITDVADKHEGVGEKVKAVCAAIKRSRDDNGVAYTQGGCYQFHLILKAIWPDAVAWYDGNHVSTEIAGQLYDINGEWSPGKNMPPYELHTEPGVLEQLKQCRYDHDTARFLKDTTPIPLRNDIAQNEMAEVLKTLNAGDKIDVDNVAAMLVVRMRARGIHLCKDSQ